MKTLMTLVMMSCSLSAFAGSNDYKYDRALTKSEIRKLLPQYVAMVEQQAASLPSASDNQTLGGAVTDPIYYAFDKDNKIIGRQSHTIDTLIESLENAAKELRAVTTATRQAEAADLVAGFKGAADAGKITCHLGYDSETKQADGRVVKCEDNRSVSGVGEDEGYYDVRVIILSIDAKTLAPVSTLFLEHPIAG